VVGLPETNTGRDSPRCCAIIAAFNEESRVAAVVSAACSSGLFSDVVVVDDGSADATAVAARSAGARVIVHERNQGKPRALLTGLNGTESETVCFLDADLLGVTTRHLQDLVEPVTSGSALATIGVFRNGRSATTLAHKVTPMISGQRCLSRELLAGFSDWNSGYGIETALNHHLKKLGVRQQLVEWRGAGQVMKEEKVGFIKGVVWRLKMFWQIFVAWLGTKFGARRR
jgi:CTP:molybdopterin cytidylyltransferase MocA